MKIAVVMPFKDEIIIVDAGSTDVSYKLLKSYEEKHFQVKVFSSPGAFPGKGRNIAIENARADIIVQIDGDSYAESNWLEKITFPIISGMADYVTGNIKIMPIYKNILGKRFDMARIYGVSLFGKGREDGLMAGGSSVAYKRSIWEKVKGFPEWTVASEDRMFAEKVKRFFNVRHKFVEDAIVYWQIGPTLRDIFKRMAAYREYKLTLPPFDNNETGKLISTFVLFLVIVILGLYKKELWLSLPIAVFIKWFHRCVKSFKRYAKYVKRSGNRITKKELCIILLSICFVEFMKIIAQIVGIIRGVLRLRERKNNLERYQDYLNE